MKSITKSGAEFLIAISRSGLRLMTETLRLTPLHAAITARAVAPAPIIKTSPMAFRLWESKAKVKPSTSVLVKFQSPSFLDKVFPL